MMVYSWELKAYVHENVIELIRAARYTLHDLEDWVEGEPPSAAKLQSCVDALGDALAAFAELD